MNDFVTCTLAHPLDEDAARSVGLEARPHDVGEEVTLVRGHATRLVSAGAVAGADPKDAGSVKKALTPAKLKTGAASAATPVEVPARPARPE